MGKGLEQMLLQRRCIDDEQTPVKRLNIISHKRNANQNYNEILLHSHQDDYNKNIVTSVEDLEKLEPSYISSGNVKWYVYFGKKKLEEDFNLLI